MNILILFLMITEGFCCYFVCGSNPYEDYTSISLVLVIVNTVILMVYLFKLEERDRKIVFIIFASYILRTGFMFFDLYGQSIFVLPNSGADTEKFQINAIMYALYGNNANYEGREIATTEILFGLFYRFFGVQRMLMQHYNVLLSIGTIYNVLSVFRNLKLKENVIHYGMVIICFLPNYMILSSLYLRESIITFFISSSVCCFANWIVKKREYWIYLAMLMSMIGSMFHSGAIVPAACYGIFLLFYDKNKEKFAISLKTIIFCCLGLLAIIILFNKFYDIFFLKLGEITSIKDITKRVSLGFGGGSDYVAPGANADSILGFLEATPARMFYFASSPVPWLWRGVQDILAFVLDALPYMAAFISGILLCFFEKDEKRKAFVLCLTLIFILETFMFGWGVNNSGTALRHRNKYISVEVLLLTVGWNLILNFKSRKKLL